jgi:NAD-dependent dihydropyrimidine dehydrogenase PreA subunit
MKAKISQERCCANPEFCEPLKQCPMEAVYYTPDEEAILGARIDVNNENCNGCGICVPICSANAISMSDM